MKTDNSDSKHAQPTINSTNTVNLMGFNLGVFGLLISSCILLAVIVAPFIKPLQEARSVEPFNVFYGGVIVLSILTACLLSAPSFKKNPYPNFLGLVSLMINVVAVTFGAYILVAVHASH